MFFLVTAATLPVVAPYLFLGDLALARRISNGISIASLYLCGHTLGRLSGSRPWAWGIAMVTIGSVLVGAIELLGG